MEYPSYNVNTPQWREITVGSHLPMELGKLAEIARNLWWTWNDDAKKYVLRPRSGALGRNGAKSDIVPGADEL